MSHFLTTEDFKWCKAQRDSRNGQSGYINLSFILTLLEIHFLLSSLQGNFLTLSHFWNLILLYVYINVYKFSYLWSKLPKFEFHECRSGLQDHEIRCLIFYPRRTRTLHLSLFQIFSYQIFCSRKNFFSQTRAYKYVNKWMYSEDWAIVCIVWLLLLHT